MWIDTIDGGLLNTAEAVAIEKATIDFGNKGEKAYEVKITLNIDPSRNPIRVVFRSEAESETDAFMNDLKEALPTLQIGDR